MIESYNFTSTHEQQHQQQFNSPLHHLVSIMNHLLSMLCCYYLDSLITLYHTQYPFYITPSSSDDDNKEDTVRHPLVAPPTTIIPPLKKPNLLIDTSTTTTTISNSKNDNTFLSQSRQHPHSAYPDVPQLLFSPTSSISSFGSSSNYHWSPDDYYYNTIHAGNSSGKRSKVEDMIHLFENGHHRYHMEQQQQQHRRHSVDSHWSNNNRKRIYIRERRYEYQPTVGEWKKRIDGEFPMHLSESKSTPIQPSKRKMAPIMETSTSLWA
ncbi:hypothetical protein MBANPS3_001433 [Mucor bainieri]